MAQKRSNSNVHLFCLKSLSVSLSLQIDANLSTTTT